MTNLEFTKTIAERAIDKFNIKDWLVEELKTTMELEKGEDDEGHTYYYYADERDGDSYIDDIADMIGADSVEHLYVKPNGNPIEEIYKNIMLAGLTELATQIRDSIYDECYERAVDELPNPNERND